MSDGGPTDALTASGGGFGGGPSGGGPFSVGERRQLLIAMALHALLPLIGSSSVWNALHSYTDRLFDVLATNTTFTDFSPDARPEYQQPTLVRDGASN